MDLNHQYSDYEPDELPITLPRINWKDFQRAIWNRKIYYDSREYSRKVRKHEALYYQNMFL